MIFFCWDAQVEYLINKPNRVCYTIRIIIKCSNVDIIKTLQFNVNGNCRGLNRIFLSIKGIAVNMQYKF